MSYKFALGKLFRKKVNYTNGHTRPHTAIHGISMPKGCFKNTFCSIVNIFCSFQNDSLPLTTRKTTTTNLLFRTFELCSRSKTSTILQGSYQNIFTNFLKCHANYITLVLLKINLRLLISNTTWHPPLRLTFYGIINYINLKIG